MSRALLMLERFLALSEAMSSAAEAQEWEDLAQIGIERAALCDALPADLAEKLPPPEVTQGRMILERCQQLDTQTRSLTEERQKALRILLREPNSVT